MDNPLTLKLVSLGLILACVVIIILFIVFVHTMPGKIAKKRNNPQTEAIEILSLLGLLIFPLWMAALVWAYIKPFQVPVLVREDGLVAPGDQDSTVSAPRRSVARADADTSPDRAAPTGEPSPSV